MPTTDTQRFAALIEPHLGALHRAAYRLCRSKPDAEDLVQDVCLRAYDHRGRLSQTDSPRAWLLRVQYNLHVDTARRERRLAAESLDAPRSADDERSTDDDSPEANADAERLAETLTDAWRSLNPDQQALMALHAEGYSLAEMMDVTGLPMSALKARLHRARTRLGKLLKTRSQPPRIAAISGESR